MNNNIFRFVYVGNLIPDKGIKIIFAACSILVKRGCINFHVHIVGASSKEYSVELLRADIHEQGVNDYLTVHGAKYGEEKNAIMEQSDAFLFPTSYHNECFPLVLLEAMQHALPIIATPVGAIPDIVEDGVNGILVPERDPEALASAMKSLMDAPVHAAQMGDRGKEKYLAEYTETQFEQRLLSIMNDAVR